MRLKTIPENNPSNPRNRFTAVAVLLGGIVITMASLPDCVSGPAPQSVNPAPAASQTSALTPNLRGSAQTSQISDFDYQGMLVSRVREAANQAGIEVSGISSMPLVTTREQVSVGSPLNGGIFNNTTVPFRVIAIDAGGVDIEGIGRLEFGRPQIIGEFLLQSLVRAEPGPDGTAFITTVTPSIYTEMTRTTSPRLESTAPAASVQTSEPVQK
ncbi:MAG: hypothetical protein V1861_03065 [Candidatus Micrarchaeota archaeon]